MKLKVDITFRVLIVIALLLGASALNTCTPSQDTARNQMSFKNDKFYFNRYTKYYDKEDSSGTYASVHDNGSIEIYGTVIVVKKTSELRTFFIIEEEYDEDEQIYTFYAEDATIVFDVQMKTLDVHYDGHGGGDVFYINSTIKSNW